MAVQRAELCSVYAYGQSEGIPSPRRLSQELVRSAAGQPKPIATTDTLCVGCCGSAHCSSNLWKSTSDDIKIERIGAHGSFNPFPAAGPTVNALGGEGLHRRDRRAARGEAVTGGLHASRRRPAAGEPALSQGRVSRAA